MSQLGRRRDRLTRNLFFYQQQRTAIASSVRPSLFNKCRMFVSLFLKTTTASGTDDPQQQQQQQQHNRLTEYQLMSEAHLTACFIRSFSVLLMSNSE